MERHFSAYKGDQPYFFVSYAHLDEELIFNELGWLIESGLNIWYDEGIEVGALWRQALADALAEANGLIFFATKNSVESKNCLNEISFAIDENIKIFVINLDDITLPRQLRFTLNDKQILVKSGFSQSSYREKLKETLKGAIKGIIRNEVPVPEPVDEALPNIKTNIPTICILPFTCPSDDTMLKFYAENIAAEIANGMESASINIVTGHPSDSAYDAKEISLKYNAEYVMSGTLIRVDEFVRARALMVETKKGKQVWAKNYEPRETQLVNSTASIAGAISANIALATPTFEIMRVEDMPVEKLDAWALGIKSMNMPIRDLSTANSWREMAVRAIDLDDTCAEVHANLADGLVTIVTANLSADPLQDKTDAIAHSYKALSLTRNKVFVLNRCSRVHRILGNEALALELAHQVDELTTGQFTYTLYPAMILNGLCQEVVDHATDNALATLAWASDACVVLGNYSLAETWIRKSVARKPERYQRWMRLANILGHLDQIEKGKEVLLEARGISPSNWSIENYEAELNSMWRNKADIVSPLVAGLHLLT